MNDGFDVYFKPRAAGQRAVPVLGAMNFGKRTPAAEAGRVIARAFERGVRLVDTANVYADGESERIVGRAIAGRRGEVLVATKVGLGRRGGRAEGLSRGVVLAACDESLRRLGVERIDVYYLHAPDHETPIDETIGAVAELVRAGKVARLGVSNHASWQLLDLGAGCARHGLEAPPISQVIYNLLVRQIEVEYLAFARAHPVHTTVYNALGGGLLAGRHRRDAAPEKGSRFDGNAMYRRRYWSGRFFDLVDAYADVAKAHGLTPVRLAYAWLAGRQGVDSVLLGPTSVEQFDDAIDAMEHDLPHEAVAAVDTIFREFQGTDASYAR